jgi:hypothetical protein
MQQITIKRATRPDIIIKNLRELTPYIHSSSKKFKRIDENNSHLFSSLFGNIYSSPVEFKKTLKKALGISGSGLINDHQILKNTFGWNQQELDELDNFLSNRTRNFLSREGISPEEYHQRNSHFNASYWTSKGFSDEEAREKVSVLQSSISKRANNETKAECSPLSNKYKGYDGLTEEETEEKIKTMQRSRSKRCPEYWTSRGHSEDEVGALVKEHQIEWISKKTPEQIEEINKKKISPLPFNSLWDDDDASGYIPGYFYIIELRRGLYKIGITSKQNGVYSRYREKDLSGRLVVLNESLPTIRKAFRIEQLLRRVFKNHIKKENAVDGFGWTETLEIDFDSLSAKYKNLFDNKEETKQLFEQIRKPKCKQP